MAQVRYFKVNVTLNPMTQQVVEVPEWELHVVQAQWGDDAQIIEDSEFTVERKLPDPRDEFERLAQRYGPRFEDTPHVASVYGNFGPGVNALRDAIAASTKPVPAPFVEETAPVAAGGVSVAELGLDEGGDTEINLDELAALTGDDTESAEAVA